MASCKECLSECDHDERCDDCGKCLSCDAPCSPTFPINVPSNPNRIRKFPFGEYERYEISHTNVPNSVYVH